jgi:hypothetical protein
LQIQNLDEKYKRDLKAQKDQANKNEQALKLKLKAAEEYQNQINALQSELVYKEQ